MAIYQITKDKLTPLTVTKFGAEGLYERKDLQRLLRDRIDVLGDDLLVVAEEFGEWDDSNRRIDLLCLDKLANLVVVELKRTDDGGHMELQAIRYAAMISPMTFADMVETFARSKSVPNPDTEAAKKEVLEFLGWTEPDEDQFGGDTRIILASADFQQGTDDLGHVAQRARSRHPLRPPEALSDGLPARCCSTCSRSCHCPRPKSSRHRSTSRRSRSGSIVPSVMA